MMQWRVWDEEWPDRDRYLTCTPEGGMDAAMEAARAYGEDNCGIIHEG